MANNNFKLNFFLIKEQSICHKEGVSEERIS